MGFPQWRDPFEDESPAATNLRMFHRNATLGAPLEYRSSPEAGVSPSISPRTRHPPDTPRSELVSEALAVQSNNNTTDATTSRPRARRNAISAPSPSDPAVQQLALQTHNRLSRSNPGQAAQAPTMAQIAIALEGVGQATAAAAEDETTGGNQSNNDFTTANPCSRSPANATPDSSFPSSPYSPLTDVQTAVRAYVRDLRAEEEGEEWESRSLKELREARA